MKLRTIAIAALLTLPFSASGSTAETGAALQTLLPPEEVVRHVLASLPASRSARIGQQLADNRLQTLNAGPHEWQLRLSHARRAEQGGASLQDQEIALERGVRWWGKTRIDQQLGEQEQKVAELRAADQWHESARTLLNDWFIVLRTGAERQHWQEQLNLSQQLTAIARKRVRAGEAAAMELMAAETEQQRIAIELNQAELSAAQTQQLLQLSYPSLPLPAAFSAPEPLPYSEERAQLVQGILEDNHEYELAEAEARLEDKQAARAQADRLPDPTIGLRASRERSGQERVIGLSISIPLGGAARRLGSEAAALKAGMAMEKQAQTRIKVQRDAEQIVLEARQNYLLWQSLDGLQKQTADQAARMMKAYQLGESSVSDTLLARKAALDARMAAETARWNAIYAWFRLKLDSHRLWIWDEAAARP